MIRFVLLSFCSGLVWAQDHDGHDHDHDHDHDHQEHDQNRHDHGHEHVEESAERTGCQLAPPKALDALRSHYEAQAHWEARQQEWAEDWGGAVFQLQEDKTQCFPFNDAWLLYAYGGVYSGKALVERHRWSDGRLVNDGVSAPPLRVEMEKDVPLLRIDTAEGCCDTRWTQSSWYTNSGGMHRVLSLPVALDPISSPWPVAHTAIWSGPEWSEEATEEPLFVSVRYVAPTLGNRELVLRGRLDGSSQVVVWPEADDAGFVSALAECSRTRRAFCPLMVLQNWVNSQVGQTLPETQGGSPRPVSSLEGHVRLESVQGDADNESLKRVLRSRQKTLLSCYERATRSGMVLKGPLVISMSVSGGQVGDLSLDAAPDHEGLSRCVEKRIGRLRFPPAVEGDFFVTWMLGDPNDE